MAMFAQPPSTFWQDAACSRADPSPGFTAKIVLPTPIFPLPAPDMSSGSSPLPASVLPVHREDMCPLRSLSVLSVLLSRVPHMPDLFLRVQTLQAPAGWNGRKKSRPDGMSSSVVVTGSWISDTTFTIRFSGSADISGQSLMFGPNWISTPGSATPWLSNTRFA